MPKVALIGAGKIGTAIADMLSGTGDYAITLLDRARLRARTGRLATSMVSHPPSTGRKTWTPPPF